MSMPAKPTKNEVLRNLPSVDELLRSERGLLIAASAGERHAASLARGVVSKLRKQVVEKAIGSDGDLHAAAVRGLEEAWQAEMRSGIRRVINATGVVIHTNLGRSRLSEAARKAI